MIKVAAAVIEHNDKILIAKRKGNKLNGGKWEFPGGKIEEGETPEECLVREIDEEFSIKIRVGKHITTNVYDYPEKTIELTAYFAEWISGTIELKDHDDIAWVMPEVLKEYDISAADIPITYKIVELKNS